MTAWAKSRRRNVACDCNCRCRCTSVHITAEPCSSRFNGGSEIISSPGDISTVKSIKVGSGGGRDGGASGRGGGGW